jgi:SNF2 family DNA or RNA helicase
MATDFKPRRYQELIVDHIIATKRCAVWSSPGTGKSASTLCALEDISLVEDVYPVLVVAPLRVARTTWPNEVKKWNHLKHLRVVPIIGSLKERQAALRIKAPIYTTNFEQLPWLVEFYGDKWPFKTLVADEATKLKGFRLRQGTQRAKALARVAHTKIKRFIELTGTPSPNGLQDLWGQAWFIDKGDRLGRTFDAFKQRWFRASRTGFGVEATEQAQEQIQAALKDVCITIDAADWFPLEEPIVNKIYVEMPPAAKIMYKQMEKQFFMELESGQQIEALNAAAKSMKLLQVASGAAYTEGSNDQWEVLHDEKLDALEEIVEESGGMPVLVAYNFRSDLVRLKKRFPDGVDLAEKGGLQRAQAGEGRVWFAHPASVGHGVDGLQYHSNIMVFFGYSWSLENYLQFIERIGPTRQFQAGFKRPVFMHLILAADTIDELVIERLHSKREVQDILLEALKHRGYRDAA